MNLLAWPLVIFGTALMAMLVSGCLTSRPATRTERLADPQPMPGELPRAGFLPFEGAADPVVFELAESHDPFAMTGPLLILSEKAAAIDAHEREVQAMIREAYRKIGPVT